MRGEHAPLGGARRKLLEKQTPSVCWPWPAPHPVRDAAWEPKAGRPFAAVGIKEAAGGSAAGEREDSSPRWSPAAAILETESS